MMKLRSFAGVCLSAAEGAQDRFWIADFWILDLGENTMNEKSWLQVLNS
jgi:hypothetical protein